jgi:hypothetical protein
MHKVQVGYQAAYRRLLAAIEILLIHAQSGQWPDALPEGLPWNPFTGEDFLYEKTEQGFSLDLNWKELSQGVKRRYEFKIRD